jgi:hypothetical protein
MFSTLLFDFVCLNWVTCGIRTMAWFGKFVFAFSVGSGTRQKGAQIVTRITTDETSEAWNSGLYLRGNPCAFSAVEDLATHEMRHEQSTQQKEHFN